MNVETETASENQIDTSGQVYLRAAAKDAYNCHKGQPAGDDLVVQFLPMIHKIVSRAAAYLKPPLSREDLVSAGIVGLLKAARDYDPSHAAEFKTYAYIRIRGSVLDELKSHTFMPGNINKQIRLAMRVRTELTEQRGSAPSDEELAGKLEISIDKLYQLFNNARAKQFISFDRSAEDESHSGLFIADSCDEPSRRIEKAELAEQLAQAISQMEEKQRHCILLYYQQELTMKQIAEVFGLTESRVSQLHAKAMFNLSAKMNQWKYDR